MLSVAYFKARFRHLGQIRLALRLVWQSSWKLTLISLGLQIAQGLSPLPVLYLLKWLIDTISMGVLADVWPLLLLLAGVSLLDRGLQAVAALVNELYTQRVIDHVSDLLHAKSIEVDLEYYEQPRYFDTLHLAQQEAPFRVTSIVNGLAQAGQQSVTLLALFGVLCALHWGIVLALIAAMLPETVARLFAADVRYRWQCEHTARTRQGWYLNWLLTGVEYAKEVRLFDTGELFRQRFRELRQQLRRGQIHMRLRQTITEMATTVITLVVMFGVYGVIAYRTMQGRLTIGALVLYYQAFQRGQGMLRSVFGNVAQLYEDTLFLSHLSDFLALPRTVIEPIAPKPMPRPIRRGIVFDRVGFRYPDGNWDVLEDVTLTIQPGEKIALVGENGAGKTTFIKLLCRLYDPTTGSISIDGVDVRDMTTTALRQEISVMFQDYGRYNFTARENIWMGNIALPPTDTRVDATARQAGAETFIRRLPQQFETRLGKWFEDGVELSSGEWQRLALARAFLREAQIVILDEPTSALDATAEAEFFHAFRQLAEHRTAILISHRFSTVRMADTIYVLSNGCIAESGSHAELMRQGGIYARMFTLQAQHFHHESDSIA